MKAWIVRDKNDDEVSCAIIFAETAGKARKVALSTTACEDSEFVNIQVSRISKADKMYKPGKKELDFSDPKDRLFLVKECGFYCISKIASECEKCQAKKYCLKNE